MSVAIQFSRTIEVTSTDCIYCGFDILLPATFKAQRQRDYQSFFCTSCGKGMVYRQGLTEADRLRKQLAEAERRATVHRDMAASERAAREATERSMRGLRGATTRIRNRIKNGVCPCCNRTFVNLQRHMGTEHPDFKPSHVVTDPPSDGSTGAQS